MGAPGDTQRPFELIPAIDLLDGRCVRLSQGRYDQATVYDEDPAAVAAGFARHSIPRLHVVDLDGARSGRTAMEGTCIRLSEENFERTPVEKNYPFRLLLKAQIILPW